VFEQAKRAHAAGCAALCITVDVPHFGRRERSLIGRHSIPGRPIDAQRAGEEFALRADWRLVGKLKRKLEVPLILKGISTAEDAQLALEHGVDVIYVSNHGGRQLDYARGAIESLPEVVSVARRKAKIIVDGGFLRGTDVVKALAMGADLVGLGRLPALALGAAGEGGVLRMLEILQQELTVTLKLLGVNRYAELDGSFLHPSAPAAWTDPFGTFRHLPGLTE
jgi:glycolate oxidase